MGVPVIGPIHTLLSGVAARVNDGAPQPADQAIGEILLELRRMEAGEGCSPDGPHNTGELARAAACYCLGLPVNEPDPVSGRRALSIWPWGQVWWKPRSRRENLVRAGALIVAEIERIDQAAARVALWSAGRLEHCTECGSFGGHADGCSRYQPVPRPLEPPPVPGPPEDESRPDYRAHHGACGA